MRKEDRALCAAKDKSPFSLIIDVRIISATIALVGPEGQAGSPAVSDVPYSSIVSKHLSVRFVMVEKTSSVG
jgi:hypothetical protein